MIQWCSQNAEKVTHNKWSLLDQAMIPFNCLPFQMRTSLKGKDLLRDGVPSLRYMQFLKVQKTSLSHLVTSIECYYFITHV